MVTLPGDLCGRKNTILKSKFYFMQKIFRVSALILFILINNVLTAQTAHQGVRYSATVSKMKQPQNLPSFEAAITPEENNQKFVLEVENPAKKRLLVTMYHSFYGEVFRKEIKEETCRHRFDMSKAEDGLYIVEISNGKEKIRKHIEINTYTQISRKIAIN